MYRRLLALFVLLVALAPASAQAVDCSVTLQSQTDNAPVGGTVLVPACTYHEMVTVNHAVTLDGQNAAVMDGTGLSNWFWINASNVTIKNFTMKNAAAADLQGGIGTQAGVAGVVIDHNDLSGTTNGAGVGIGGTTDSKVTNNTIHANGEAGITTFQNTRLLVQGNHLFGNNTTNSTFGYVASGVKLANDNGSQILNNEVDHNQGMGIWVDVASSNVTIAGNNVHDQAFNPIEYEISSFGDIHDNTVTNSPGNVNINWGCIISSSSGDVNIHNNTCVNAAEYLALYDNRTDRPADAGTNVVIQNNTITMPTNGVATRWWQYTSTGPLVPGTNGNMDSNNQILGLTPTATVTPTATNTPAPTATPKPTVVPSPTISCQVNVRLNGVERGWKPC